jgi:hypothetical protein
VPSIYIDHKGFKRMLKKFTEAGVEVSFQKDA